MFDRLLMAGRNSVMQGALLKLQTAYDGLKIVEQEAQRQVRDLERQAEYIGDKNKELHAKVAQYQNDLANKVWMYGIEMEAQRKVREKCCTPCGKFICSTPFTCKAIVHVTRCGAKLTAEDIERHVAAAEPKKPRQRVLYYVNSTLSREWLYVYATDMRDLGEHRNGHVMRCQNTEAGRKVAEEFVEFMNKQAQVK